MSVIQIPALAHGGPLRNPRLIVIHCGETPLAAGVATGKGGAGWFANPKSGTSAHRYFDPKNSVQCVPLSTTAYHVGPYGNGISIGYEHAGRASFTKAQWLSDPGRDMLAISAEQAALDAKALNIPPRWLTLTQIARGERGFCTHNDIRLALGGTTHSDPGPNFPYAEYMALVIAFYNPRPAAAKPPVISFQEVHMRVISNSKGQGLAGPDGVVSLATPDQVRACVKVFGLTSLTDAEYSNVQDALSRYATLGKA